MSNIDIEILLNHAKKLTTEGKVIDHLSKDEVLVIMGLDIKTSNETIIRKKYTTLARSLHPDKNKEERTEAHEAFCFLGSVFSRLNEINSNADNLKSFSTNKNKFTKKQSFNSKHDFYKKKYFQGVSDNNQNTEQGSFWYIVINLSLRLNSNHADSIKAVIKQYTYISKFQNTGIGRSYVPPLIHCTLQSVFYDKAYRPDLGDIIIKTKNLQENLSVDDISLVHIHDKLNNSFQVVKNTLFKDAVYKEPEDNNDDILNQAFYGKNNYEDGNCKINNNYLRKICQIAEKNVRYKGVMSLWVAGKKVRINHTDYVIPDKLAGAIRLLTQNDYNLEYNEFKNKLSCRLKEQLVGINLSDKPYNRTEKTHNLYSSIQTTNTELNTVFDKYIDADLSHIDNLI